MYYSDLFLDSKDGWLRWQFAIACVCAAAAIYLLKRPWEKARYRALLCEMRDVRDVGATRGQLSVLAR